LIVSKTSASVIGDHIKSITNTQKLFMRDTNKTIITHHHW